MDGEWRAVSEICQPSSGKVAHQGGCGVPKSIE